MDKYEVMKSDCELCMLMVHKNQEASYVQLILEELKMQSSDFGRLFDNVFEIQ